MLSLTLFLSNRCRVSGLFAMAALLISLSLFPVSAAQTDIAGPAGSGSFGGQVTVLPNGNFVVIDTGYDLSGPTVTDVGAAYLYNGATLSIISTLKGSTASDQVGSGGIVVLSNGNYVVRSPNWDNLSPVAADSGAITWCSAVTGCNGTVSAANSLVGGTASDQVGSGGITVLTNGNYVVSSLNWDNLSALNAGAVTWGNGAGGTVGLVSGGNSLIGATASDGVGKVTALTNGNYVVSSPNWDNLGSINVGAVTWGNGAGGTTGLITSSNSLIGAAANDNVGSFVTALTNGKYVVNSGNWDNPSTSVVNAGAVTLGNGAGGTVGLVTSANSLVGGTANDFVGGFFGVTALTNGNYVVSSSGWDNPSPLTADVGAVTWCSGATGCNGTVSLANSLVGGTASDSVGQTVRALTNGNYVVTSTSWDNPSPLISNVGAVTWGNGSGGTVGLVTASNSLVGGTAGDTIGIDSTTNTYVTALTNGNYVVCSSSWDNGGIVNAGAVTWGNGLGGTVGLVSSSNSLVGGAANDAVGGYGITVLTNGNYVAHSPFWDNGGIVNAGAVTWGNALGGPVGVVASGNSLVGGSASDQVGFERVAALTNGNYVVRSSSWDNGGIVNAGAATWGNGAGGTVGLVTSANSLVGGTANDSISNGGVTALSNGNYAVVSGNWDNPSPLILNVGAITWGKGSGGTVGLVAASNSLVGGTGSDFIGSSNSGGNLVTALNNGNYVVLSSSWDNPLPLVLDARAVTYGKGGSNGLITAGNSVLGTVTGGISGFSVDSLRNRVFVGRGASNIVSVLIIPVPFDFDGDGKTDAAVYRPSAGDWYLLRSTAGFGAFHFGSPSDIFVPADYTGDGKTDMAVFRPSVGTWFVLRSEDFTFYGAGFGVSGDIPSPGDFDGDGKADTVVFRPSNGTWYLNRSTAGFNAVQFGQNGDVPAAGDFDGDGKNDISVYRPSQGQWFRLNSNNGSFYGIQFGSPGDKIVPADYTGDGKTDYAVFRPSNSNWYILRSDNNTFYGGAFGSPGDLPSPGDYDGDGRADLAVWRPGTQSIFYIMGSTSGFTVIPWGIAEDRPVANAYVY